MGEVALPDTPLQRLRLRQLRDLAKAFNIDIDQEATKAQILPALIAAEQRGVFKNVASADRARLMRANYNSDEGKINFPEAEILELERTDEPVKHVLSRPAKPDITAVEEWRQIVARVKEVMGQDYKTFGKKKEELLFVLQENDPEGPFSDYTVVERHAD
jgi:hypothetical protein